jgi:hypothetical protein
MPAVCRKPYHWLDLAAMLAGLAAPVYGLSLLTCLRCGRAISSSSLHDPVSGVALLAAREPG